MKKIILFTISVALYFNCFTQNWQYQTGHSSIYSSQYGLCFLNENTIITVGDFGIIEKTTNGGEYWDTIFSGVEEPLIDIAFFDLDSGYIVGSNGTILKSLDSGNNWTTVNSNTSHRLTKVFIKEDGEIWAVGDNGTIIHSVDNGFSWVLVNAGTTASLNDIQFYNNDSAVIVGNDGTILVSENQGESWSSIDIGITDDLFALNCLSSKSYFLAGVVGEFFKEAEQIYMSDDFFNWSFHCNVPTIYSAQDLFFINDSTGIVCSSIMPSKGNYIEIMKTSDNGSHWQASFLDENTGGVSYFPDVKFFNDTLGYFITGNQILKTQNGGGTFIYAKESIEKINCYYNRGCLYIYGLEYDEYSIDVYNLFGQKNLTKRVTKNDFKIDTGNLKTGVYFYSFYHENCFICSNKFVVW